MKHILLLVGIWLGTVALFQAGIRAEPIIALGAIVISIITIAHMNMQDRASRRDSSAQRALPDAQLAQINERLETIAIEVERIGEGQRFLTKLAAGRDPAAQLGAPHERAVLRQPAEP